MIARTAALITIAMAVIAVVVGCGDPPAHVTLTPISGPCGLVGSGATGLTVTALSDDGATTQAVTLGSAVELPSFPSTTAQLTVEVLGGSGEPVAIGKTAPLAFDALADGAKIPIFMAPPDGFCPTGDLSAARIAPLVARAGSGVLVVGGSDVSGPLATAELYDPATATFSPVDVPEALGAADGGFAGMALTTLADGSVVLTGGGANAFSRFDPTTKAFSEPILIDARAFHAAIATDAEHLMLAGGCHGVSGGACEVPTLRSSKVYAVAAPGTPAVGPTLTGARIGAQLFDLGAQLDGTHPYLIAGGSGDPGGDRFALTDDAATALTGGNAYTAQLDGGGVLTAFADDAQPASGATSVFTPAGDDRALASLAARTGARLIALEDGSVVAVGGDPAGMIARYSPTGDAWSVIAPGGDGPGPITAPSLIRLDDGTVLVLGGQPTSAHAWIYRPSLDGPYMASALAMPATGEGPVLTPTDPQNVTRTSGWTLGVLPGSATDLAPALIGGPRMITGSIIANTHVESGGFALIAQQVAPGEAVIARLDPGAAASIARWTGGVKGASCTGLTVATFDPAVGATVELMIAGTTATLSLGGAGLVSCDLGNGERGSWGVAAAGSGAAAAIDAVTIQRP